jgi:hypothetical protein
MACRPREYYLYSFERCADRLLLYFRAPATLTERSARCNRVRGPVRSYAASSCHFAGLADCRRNLYLHFGDTRFCSAPLRIRRDHVRHFLYRQLRRYPARTRLENMVRAGRNRYVDAVTRDYVVGVLAIAGGARTARERGRGSKIVRVVTQTEFDQRFFVARRPLRFAVYPFDQFGEEPVMPSWCSDEQKAQGLVGGVLEGMTHAGLNYSAFTRVDHSIAVVDRRIECSLKDVERLGHAFVIVRRGSWELRRQHHLNHGESTGRVIRRCMYVDEGPERLQGTCRRREGWRAHEYIRGERRKLRS